MIQGRIVPIAEATVLQRIGVTRPNPNFGLSGHPEGHLRKLFVAKYSILWRPEPLPEDEQYAIVYEA